MAKPSSRQLSEVGSGAAGILTANEQSKTQPVPLDKAPDDNITTV